MQRENERDHSTESFFSVLGAPLELHIRLSSALFK